jgi:hypothetical protein
VAVDPHMELQLTTQALSITTFRYVPRDLRARVGEPEAEARLGRAVDADLRPDGV